MDWSKLVGNARQYADILRRCSLEEVGNWKETDLQRGFQWAEYFQKVHHKVKGKEALAAQLDAKLREVGRDVGVRFGGRELTHSFLAESCLHCCKVLLENPALPAELRKMVLAKNPDVLKSHLDGFTAEQELLHTLSAMQAELSPSAQGNAILCTDAVFILDDLTWLAGSTAKEEEGVLNNRLSEICQLENGLLALCHTLVVVIDTPSQGSGRYDQTREAIARWLLAKHSDELWKQSPKLLARAASNFTFFRAYVRHLTSEGDRIQSESLFWSAGEQSEELKACFAELVSSGDERVREVTVSLLREKTASSSSSCGVGFNLWDQIYKSVLERIDDK